MAKVSKHVREAIARCDEARNFPVNTCGASRHAQMIAEFMAEGRMPDDKASREHMAESILATVAALWELRTRHPEPERDAEALADAMAALERLKQEPPK